MMNVRHSLVGLILWGCLAWAGPVHADAITEWNGIAVRTATLGRPGPPGFLDLALVHAAMHDAVQAFEGRYQPYLKAIQQASGSPVAAAAGAAHGVLVGLYPAQQAALDADLQAFLQANGLVGDAGLDVGYTAAAHLLTQYRAAPNPPLPPFTGQTKVGQWRPTPSYIGDPPSPPSFAPMALVYLAYTQPYTLKKPSQFRAAPPPPIASERYRRDYDEVRDYGARFNSLRTPEQTDLAYFWSDNVVRQWNEALRGVAAAHLASLGDSARLFALANLATSDALITAWDTKMHYNFWRPITAIHEGDTDGNRKTVGDPDWQPLVNTPNYSEYASGANNVSGAMTATMRLVFGTDHLPFTITSNAPNVQQRTRSYVRLSDAAQEVVDGRMLLGFHFRFADEVGRRQGQRVAAWTFTHTLRPRHREK